MYKSQNYDRISEYAALNKVAEQGGVVLFGSTSASKLPLNELTQDYGITTALYNRSAENLTINGAEKYISECIAPLRPKVILMHFGEEELSDETKSINEIIEAYRWLLYQIHTATPESRLVIVSVNSEIPNSKSFNDELKLLAREYGCEFAYGPNGNFDGTYTIRFFHTLRSFLFDRTMSLADALRFSV